MNKVPALLFLLSLNILTSSSFHVGQFRVANLRRDSETAFFASAVDGDEDNKAQTKLTFSVQIDNISSNPCAFSSKEKLEDFFQKPENRALLATAGGKRKWEEIEATPQILQDWKDVCDEQGIQYPDGEDDAILSVQTGGIDFPGLHMKTVAKIGVKLTKNPNDASLQYEYSLLGDERFVTGLPPIVWIFNKLTGSGKESDGTQDASTKSLSVVGYKIVDDDKVIFTIDTRLEVKVKFPSILLKLLPTNKEKAEQTGSQAITKAVEKDIVGAMKVFQEAYLESLNAV